MLSKIDKLVDSTAGHELLTFIDAFSGYHQIPLAKEDKEKTSFITDTSLYYYNMMLFGLKNARAIYQWLSTRSSRPSIEGQMEVYVDDMITKSVKEVNHVRDLEETFEILKHYVIKLNPKKCTLGVKFEKILRYMIDQLRIEAYFYKVQAVLKMKSLIPMEEVQKLTGCIAALGIFMLRSIDKCLPFFKVLKKKVQFR